MSSAALPVRWGIVLPSCPQANSPVWSDRAAACCGLSAILQSRRQSELESIFDKAVSTLHGCLSDPHHRSGY